jgi:hypothetical protein
MGGAYGRHRPAQHGRITADGGATMSETEDTTTQAPQEPPEKTPIVTIHDNRTWADSSRTSPRMRFDVLQIAAWVLGLYLVGAGLITIARAGFDELALFEPEVQIGGMAATPLLGLLFLVVGVLLLAAGTGEVAEQRLRIVGVLLGVIGVVWLVEPDPFTEYLGVTRDSGVALLGMGILLASTSFLPALSIKRPGVKDDPPKRR